MMAPEYVRDPAEIYRQSFETIEREADLGRYSPGMRDVAIRLVHSCGMVNVLDDLAYSPNAVERAKSALASGCKIFCDVEMVKAGIIRKFLTAGNEVVCSLNDPGVPELAERIANTRSAAASQLWDGIDGAIVVIGNAPTVLFHLLDRINSGEVKPALIVGVPVGFVGAVESKEALALNTDDVEFITVHGRRGGSAMASAILNGLARLA